MVTRVRSRPGTSRLCCQPASPAALPLGQPDNLAQNLRNRSRCQRITVSDFTCSSEPRHACQTRDRPTQNNRSKVVRTGSLVRSLEDRDLQPEGGILDRDRPMPAQQKSKESEDGQKEACQVLRLFVSIQSHVNQFQTDLLMANDRLACSVPLVSLPGFCLLAKECMAECKWPIPSRHLGEQNRPLAWCCRAP